MNKTMTTNIGDYEIYYNIVKENNYYCIDVSEKENSQVIISGKFAISIDNNESAKELIDILCENQVGVVHMNDILDEMGYLIK